MHFDSRTQQALREAGLSTDDLRAVDERVKALVAADADALAAFFAANDTVYSDMDLAHGADDVVEHDVDHLDCYTHGDELRGYLKFETWGVPVEGGRPLDDGADEDGETGGSDGGGPDADGSPPRVVELTLGPTVDGRTRFAADRDAL